MVRPHITVATVVEAQRRFLLVEEKIQGKVVFNQPAGHLKTDEDVVDGAKRELWEETGLDLSPQALTGIYLFDVPREDRSYLRFNFSLALDEPVGTAPRDPSIIRCHWLSLEQIRELDEERKLRSPLVLSSIVDYLKGHEYPLSILHRFLPATEPSL
ncbi:Phosphatase NudJ [Saliniradius amylolyticus]|uniref:Phosphatase NudJ n=1 Tax=Saliniradius amylolyticus TaxID=2183582 RepID=A0A2S2E374_9ALTE|nr:NUDIX hydrolase [Saliniradius amylolyticus]AWL12093.1 Phosphatase NudJ [Saliniradius amylolyticus]